MFATLYAANRLAQWANHGFQSPFEADVFATPSPGAVPLFEGAEFQSPFEADVFATDSWHEIIHDALCCSFNPLSRLMCLQQVRQPVNRLGFSAFQSPFEADVFATLKCGNEFKVITCWSFNPLSRLMCLQL